jgi:hypothetical protein
MTQTCCYGVVTRWFVLRVLKWVRVVPSTMSDDLEAAVERFLSNAESAYAEYEKGYANPDVVLDRIRGHLDELERELE